MEEREGSLITRGDLAQLQQRLELTEPFAASFGDPLPLTVMAFGEEPGEHDMPDPFAAQAECGAIVSTLFDLFGDTRMENHAAEVAWGFVNSFHFVKDKIKREEDRLAAELLDMTRRMEPSEIFNKELEDLQLQCQSLAERRACMEAMRDYAAAMYRACSGHVWTPSRGSRASYATASYISARDFVRARAENRRDRHNPKGPIVVVSGPTDWHDYELIWNRLDLILQRIPNMVLLTTGQKKGVDAAAASWAFAKGRDCIGYDFSTSGKGNDKAFRRNEQINELTIVEAILCQGSGIQGDLYDLFNPETGRQVPTHCFWRDQQKVMPPIERPRRFGRSSSR
ncbi:hypothetical protein CAF53_02430 [Sphingobium sp. LB126]|nr:hypothetical protein CAF53_02430 [Sphingobium sp. LB126]